jgi:hypothetical protein
MAISGSALANEDFSMDMQQLSFPPNSAEPQCAGIQTTENSVLERPEEFWVLLGLTEGQNSRISLGTEISANVTINDDDCEFLIMCWSCDSALYNNIPPCSCGCWV